MVTKVGKPRWSLSHQNVVIEKKIAKATLKSHLRDFDYSLDSAASLNAEAEEVVVAVVEEAAVAAPKARILPQRERRPESPKLLQALQEPPRASGSVRLAASATAPWTD